MLGLSQKLSRPLAALFGLALALPTIAQAQVAPAIGDHPAARPSDTGFADAVNSTGGYGASLPLNLPGVKGGLPLPLSVVYGGHRFGAAGRSWDVPFSSIRRNVTVAHRRPASNPDASPQGREQLSLNGTDLVPMGQNSTGQNIWRARGSEQIEVRDLLGGVLEMVDGNGLRHVFSSAGGALGHPLDGGNLYLLTDIFGPAGAKVHLDYSFGAPSLGGGSTGLSIDLTRVSYNYDANGACAKHIVNLNYGADAPIGRPLSISMLGSTALVRLHKLKESREGPAIDVTAREVAADQPQPCTGAMKSLRSYNFTYQPGADTGQPQLSQVTMIGQEGTDERNVTLPVATYTYGQVTGQDGKLHYVAGQQFSSDLPSGFDTTFAFARTQSATDHTDTTDQFFTWTPQNIIDVNGDGRADLLYRDPNTDFQSAGLNSPLPGGASQFTPFNPGNDPSGPGPHFPFTGSTASTQKRQVDNFIPAGGNFHQTWIQSIDWNGDGRLDFVNANEVDNAWVVYLNTPHPADPKRIVWQRRLIDIRPLIRALGLTEPGIFEPVRVPLSQSVTVQNRHFNHCWQWHTDASGTFDWHSSLLGYNIASGICKGPQGQRGDLDDFGWTDQAAKTITQWQLLDLNGDGYPDFVYMPSDVNSGIGTVSSDVPRPFSDGFPGQFFETVEIQVNDIRGSADVMALINVAGVHLKAGQDQVVDTDPDTGLQHLSLVEGTSAFSAPIMIEAGSVSQRCGVSRWEGELGSPGGGTTIQLCGFADVNGDGLVDRLNSSNLNNPAAVGVARLGTGNLNAPFSGAMIDLPGPMERTQTDLVATDNLGHFKPVGCPANAPVPSASPDGFPLATYPVRRTAGLRDLNGDGIPDYISRDPSENWTVAMGTGFGFATQKAIVTPLTFELSFEIVGCFADNTGAGTTAGLFELDGDGVPEILQQFNGGFKVYKLDAVHQADGSNVPAASGRLAQIGNGYGASTNIIYGSAKEDASTNHLLPNPEIVVASVTTTDASNNQLVQPVLYAYGGASQFFDAAADRWVFPGYQRKVTLQNTGDPNDQGAGKAVISDTWPLATFDRNADPTERLSRYLIAGRTSDITTLSGSTSEGSGDLGSDPWALLTVDVTSDVRRIGASHMDYTARLLPVGSNAVADPNSPQFCLDMGFPYNYDSSLFFANDTAHQSFDQCAERGFALQTSVISYRSNWFMTDLGTADVITSSHIVKTGSVITAFDNFGRVTDSTSHGDLADPSTDLCMHVDYASPTPNLTVRVLNAPAQQMVQDCHGVTLAKKRFEYDGFTASAGNPVGQVSDGFVTSSTVTRYDENHAPLGDIRLFDATYNADGTLQSTTKTRDEDNARNGTNFSYDPFGLVLTRQDNWSTGTNFDTLFTVFTPDPVTLNITSTTDTNGTVRGATYDGFGRILQSKITPPGGVEGILSSNAYFGFELNALQQRSITQKVFTDAATDVSAPSRDSEVAFDILGRPTGTFVHLGADYQFRTVIVGARTYDALGRVKFMADPMLSNDDISTAYGTSYNYNTNGTPTCFVRGTGVKPAFASLNETNEVYPTCFEHFFDNNKEVLRRHDPDSGGAVNKDTTLNALGRVLQSRAFTSATHGQPEVDFKRAVFGYDALGHMTSMTRYQDATNQTGAVTTTWHYDSLGWMTKLEEPGVAAQTRSFDNWGEITQVQWCEDLSAAPCPGQDRSSITQYDAIGRVTHREDQVGGQTVPGTVNDYTYDVGVENTTPPVTATNTLGRLASASWPTGAASFSYDGFGRMNAKVFTDTSVTPNKVYVETHEIHDDGSEKTLHLLLPDNGFTDEKVDYDYDTAGRIKSALYNDGATPPTTQSLFAASGSTPIYDIFGRINNAKYGLTSFNATFAAAGRRLLTDVKVTSGDQAHSREIAFPTLNGVTPYDPQGRETQRREFTDGAAPTALLRSYDPIGQLSAAQNLQVATNTTQADRAFTYDPLGNILFQTDSGTPQIGSVGLTYDAADLDRVCGIAYEGAPLPIHCNVTYDGAGDITSMPTRSGTPHSFTYFPSGHVSGIASGGSLASFAYDAFGALQQLTLNTPQTDMRADKYFGALLKQRIEGSNSVLTRKIPAPGLVATRHGPTGGWTFAFGEPRGTRFVTDQAGAFVQDIDYQPFGEVKNPTGATPGSTNYTSEQWNRGDLLKAFGVVKLGARLYDPVIGRFLSRDPIISTRNPYSFADNDPVNKSDPTGLKPCDGQENTNCDPAGTPPLSDSDLQKLADANPIRVYGCYFCIPRSPFADVPWGGFLDSGPYIPNTASGASGTVVARSNPFYDASGHCIQDCGARKSEFDTCFDYGQRCGAKAAGQAGIEAAKIAAAVVITKAGTTVAGKIWDKVYGKAANAGKGLWSKLFRGAGEEAEDVAEGTGGGALRTPGAASRSSVGPSQTSADGSRDFFFDGKNIGKVTDAGGGRLTLTGSVDKADLNTVIQEALANNISNIRGTASMDLINAFNKANLDIYRGGGSTIIGVSRGAPLDQGPARALFELDPDADPF